MFFHVFQIAQMVTNRAKHLILWYSIEYLQCWDHTSKNKFDVYSCWNIAEYAAFLLSLEYSMEKWECRDLRIFWKVLEESILFNGREQIYFFNNTLT